MQKGRLRPHREHSRAVARREPASGARAPCDEPAGAAVHDALGPGIWIPQGSATRTPMVTRGSVCDSHYHFFGRFRWRKSVFSVKKVCFSFEYCVFQQSFQNFAKI